MIFLDDTIKQVINGTHYRTKYRANCDVCGEDRGYLSKRNAMKKFCAKCSPRHTEESKRKMRAARLGKEPWNKNKKEIRSAVIDKLSKAKIGKNPPNKGQRMTFEQKVKLSCAARGINLNDFDDFKTETSKIERNRFAELGLHVQRFEIDRYRCAACNVDSVTLNAHHKNSWKHFPDQRFDVANLISLCVTCHKQFHNVYGNGKSQPNTEEQMNLFIKSRSTTDKVKKIIVVAGASGSGKSWVCDRLKNTVSYMPYDKVDKKNIRSIMWNSQSELIIYDPTTHVSSFIKRNSDLFEIELVVIQEKQEVIESRLIARGGKLTESVKRRIARMKKLSEKSIFTGTSEEVLRYLRNKLNADSQNEKGTTSDALF